MAPFGRGYLRSFEELRENASALIAQFEKAGFIVTSRCRLRKYLSHFERIEKENAGRHWVRFPEGDMYFAGVATRELTQFSRIADAMLPRQSVWKEKLREILTGAHALPELDKQPFARSVQFELALAASFLSQRVPVRPAHADLEIKTGRVTVAIAAKRLLSEKKLRERLSEASRQIVESGRPGIVAVEVTHLLYRNGEVINAPSERHGTFMAQQMLERWLSANAAPFQESLDHRHVMGAIAAHAPLMFNSLERYNVVLSEAFPVAVWGPEDVRTPILRKVAHALNGHF